MRLKNQILLATIFFFLMIKTLFAQQIQWQQTIGGDSTDYFSVVHQTFDGGFIIGGSSLSDSSFDKTTNTKGNMDYWIVKINSSGIIEWQKDIGGSDDDWLNDIHQTADSGYVAVGFSWSGISGDKTDSSRGGSDYWIVKLDAEGNIIWQKTIGGNYPDELYSFQQTLDGGYILGGSSMSPISGDKTDSCKGSFDYWLIKLNSLGTIEWQKTIGGNQNDVLTGVQQTADSGYIIGGRSYSNISGDKTENCYGYADYWVVKTDSLGNIMWQKTLGGNNTDDLLSIKETDMGEYILAGVSSSGISGNKTEFNRGNGDYWIIKLDNIGNIQWQKVYGGTLDDAAYSIVQTFDKGFFIGGVSLSDSSFEKSESCRGVRDYWVIKIDSIGTIQWQKTIGGMGWDECYSVDTTNDDGFILGGLSASGIGFEKTEPCLGGVDYWIVKLNAPVGIDENNGVRQLNFYPMPIATMSTLSFKNEEHQKVKLSIYGALGNLIEIKETLSSSFQIDKGRKLPGIYFYSLLFNETQRMEMGKFVIE